MDNSPNTPERNAAYRAASDATNARWEAEKVGDIARCSLFDSILETQVTSPSPGHGAAIKVTKDYYNQLVAHGNLSSYSMDTVFHACPRKYAIKKMMAKAGTVERMNSPTFAFGHAVGAGVAVYDQAQDLRESIWATFLAWDIDLLEEEVNKSGKKTGKSFFEAVWALYVYQTFWEEETNLSEYDSVQIEASLIVDFEDGHYYSGHIDEVMIHRDTGRYLVKENKTTGMKTVDPCQYSNSDQALSYAVVVDMLGGTEYEVLYTVYLSSEQRWLSMSFVKGPNKKAEWIQDQLLMHQHKDDYASAGFWPKRGASCWSFMRRCEFYGDCDLSFDNRFGMDYAALPKITSIADVAAIEHVDYATTLTAIVERQKAKLNERTE